MGVEYQVQANYAGGSSSPSTAWLELGSWSLFPFTASLVPGPQGSVMLAVPNLPPGTVALRLTRVDDFSNGGVDTYVQTNFDISISTATNGLYPVPASWPTPSISPGGSAQYEWWVQTVSTNDDPSAPAWLTDGYYSSNSPSTWLEQPFYDGRVQLKQDLIFLLRAASQNQPFSFNEYNTNYFYAGDAGYNGYYFVYSFTNPTNYAWASPYNANGEFQVDNSQFFSWDPIEPFDDNYRYENFVFNLANVDSSGRLTTGVDSQMELWNPTYQISYPPTSDQIATAFLSTSQSRWLYSEWEVDQGNVLSQNFPNYSMAANTRNFFGLSNLSAELVYATSGGLAETTLPAGGNVTLPSDALTLWIYMETAQPQFQTVEYDFWNPAASSYQTPTTQDLVPGMPGFSTTNTSRLMIAGVGNSINVAGYAKLAVLNGYSGVYAYLGQYFDQAYQIDDTGDVTTNTTGVLSPYGQFFATQPGPVALRTMPDVDTGERGTCAVYCVSLAVDKNHDGTMDLSWNGPDATSPASPMECWINNGYDFSSGSSDPFGHDVESQYDANYQEPAIPCVRDLENWFRLWICGLPSLPTSQGYTVTMSMSALNGSPAINMVNAVETNGGTLYLTDTNTAFAQVANPMGFGYGEKYQTISPTNSVTLPADLFTNGGNTYFLFEGAGIGEGQLTMTISQNGNTIAQTSAYLDIHDIKDFYERAVITNIYNGTDSSAWSSTIETLQPAVANLLGNDTNLIVFVHGFNVGDWDWLDDSDTVLKRLYWVGFRGDFMTVKWPCETSPLLYDLSELDAYKASAALATYLSQLRIRYPSYRLNLLVHSQGNTITSEAIAKGAPFDTYILSQGAMPASCYDVNAPTDSDLLNQESISPTPDWQPMGYHGDYTNITGQIVNFYNPVDFALMTGKILGIPTNWKENQLLKPESPYSSDGTNVWDDGMPVTDPDEARAFAARSRTDAVGATAGLAGVIDGSIDLQTQFGFGDALEDHSAQWTWPIQTSLPYYYMVMSAYNIPTHQLQ